MCIDVVKAFSEAEAHVGAETIPEIKAKIGKCIIRLQRSVNSF